MGVRAVLGIMPGRLFFFFFFFFFSQTSRRLQCKLTSSNEASSSDLRQLNSAEAELCRMHHEVLAACMALRISILSLSTHRPRWLCPERRYHSAFRWQPVLPRMWHMQLHPDQICQLQRICSCQPASYARAMPCSNLYWSNLSACLQSRPSCR